jgi:hypothetical protein
METSATKNIEVPSLAPNAKVDTVANALGEIERELIEPLPKCLPRSREDPAITKALLQRKEVHKRMPQTPALLKFWKAWVKGNLRTHFLSWI